MQAPPEIHLMANTRRNTVIVNAPPDKMGIIKSAIWKIDVPSDRAVPFRQHAADAAVPPGDARSRGGRQLPRNGRRSRPADEARHRQEEPVPSSPMRRPRTRRSSPPWSRTSTAADRNLKVIQLRKLDADLVAGTIRMLMVGDDKNANNNNNNGYGGGRRFGLVRRFGMQNQHRRTVHQQVPRRSRYRRKPPAGLCQHGRIGEGLQVPGRDGRSARAASTASKRCACSTWVPATTSKVLLERLRRCGRRSERTATSSSSTCQRKKTATGSGGVKARAEACKSRPATPVRLKHQRQCAQHFRQHGRALRRLTSAPVVQSRRPEATSGRR